MTIYKKSDGYHHELNFKSFSPRSVFKFGNDLATKDPIGLAGMTNASFFKQIKAYI